MSPKIIGFQKLLDQKIIDVLEDMEVIEVLE